MLFRSQEPIDRDWSQLIQWTGCANIANPLLGTDPRCFRYPVSITGSVDPNDKVGTLGAGPNRFLQNETPLRYTVFFENLPTAGAPAQEVVITDQLDPNKVDLTTFQLGSITFGDITVPLPPALWG